MQKRNWRQYNKDLVQQGSLSFFIDPKVFKTMQMGQRSKGRGRPMQFSDVLIQMLLMIKIRFRLPYRAVEGFAKSLFEEKDLSMPSYSLICKRVGDLNLSLPILNSRKAVVIILDASGAKVCGEGEWKVKIHGRGRPRKWVKLHIAIDAASQEILAEHTTESNTADGSMTEKLCNKVRGKIKLVLADGAYDGKKSREAIRKRNAQALIPPPKNARYRGTNSERDQAIAVIRGLGGDKEAKSIWGKLSGYSRRVLVETAFSRMKRRFGDRLFSKSFDKQRIENTARCLLLNEMRVR
jgi:hypothetical protein